MPLQLPPEILDNQGMVIARRQGVSAGIDTETMRTALRNGRWQPMQRGVYATFTGEPTREARLWAALLRAGEGAALSYWTAAERHGLLKNPSQSIHITVPAGRNPAKRGRIPGVVIHRSDSVLRTTHPAMRPPCTRVEDTVLDLIAAARTIDEAYGWIARALGRRRPHTTPARVRAALDERARFRWREDVSLALGDAESGIHSWLEFQYVRKVEKPHGLPAARRQVRVPQGTKNCYLDNLYEGYGVCVELDGAAAHPAAEHWRDKRRDNRNLAQTGLLTMRLGFLDLHDRERQCQTAALVSALLCRQGLDPSIPHPCSSCAALRGAFWGLCA